MFGHSPAASRTRTLLMALGIAAFFAPASLGQCQLLVRESFRPGDRPHGNNGRLRDAQIHDTLKDYWPQVGPPGAMWMANDQTGVPTWAFAGSSLDPAEVDPLDSFNGTAFGEAPAAAVLPFVAPSAPITVSAEAVMLFGSTSATYMGFTSSPALLSNFESFGTLWMSLDGQGNWAIFASGANLVVGGSAPIVGTLDSGWLHMEFTFDPATSTVSGRVMGTTIPPTPVVLDRALAYFGMEAHDSWNVLNNVSISTGTRLAAAVADPGPVCRGVPSLTLHATTNATEPASIRWSRSGGWPITDGPQPGGSVISGAQTSALVISGPTSGDSGEYFCIVSNACGSLFSNRVNVQFGGCPADYNCSGSVTVQDIFDFLGAYFAGVLQADFDNSGTISVQDIFDFLAVYFAGCS